MLQGRNNFPKVSVIVTSYNSAEFIRETLDSLLQQNFKEFEVIVIDDCSSDETTQIVQSVNSDKIRLVVLDRNHGGPSRPRSVGVRESRAKYVAFIDADDLLQQNMLSEATTFLDMCPELGLCFTNAIKFNHETGVDEQPFLSNYRMFNSLPKRQVKDKCFLINQKQAHRCLFFENYILTGCVMAPRAIFDKVGFFDETLKNSDDRDMWLRITNKFPIGFIDSIGLRYRVHEGSISKRGAVLSENRIKVLRKHQSKDIPIEIQRQIKKLIAENFFGAAYAYQSSGKILKARKYYWDSILSKPSFAAAKGILITFLGAQLYYMLKKTKNQILEARKRL